MRKRQIKKYERQIILPIIGREGQTKTIGRPKVFSAKQRLTDLNKDVEVITYKTKITSENILDIMKDYRGKSAIMSQRRVRSCVESLSGVKW